ncbi:MAG: hypothetical protein HYZ75_15475 [Elusimicrobia bacterium]|nr:hypothetical protein [Elusimicrobiota bacterium]
MNSAVPTRLFRADTLHDIASAAVVLRNLPAGRDVLAFSMDKSAEATQSLANKMRIMARSHAWSEVVDISGLPLAPHIKSGAPPRSRLRRLRDITASVSGLRRMLAPAFGLPPEHPSLRALLAKKVDELYLTCFHHADVQALYGIFPSARKIYTPHGFDSLSLTELTFYSRHCSDFLRSGGRSSVERLKAGLFGDDAVLPRRMSVDEAYSFNLPMPWARVQHDLRPHIGRDTMLRFFADLPEAVRDYFEQLARRCGENTPLLLLAPYDPDLEPHSERLTRSIVKLAYAMVQREGASSLLIKPHPRNSEAQVSSVLERIGHASPNTALIAVREHSEFPIEITLAPFLIRSCGSFGSSAMRALKRIYGTTSYCPEQDLIDHYTCLAFSPEDITTWIEDNKQDYTAI